MTNKCAVLIFGTFNPVTVAHIEVARKAEEKVPGADVFFVIAPDQFLEGYKGLSADNVMDERVRLNLLKEAISPYSYMKVSEVELNRISDGKTYNTVAVHKKEYDEVYICFGTDKICELDTWFRAEDLVKENRFLVMTRGETLSEVISESRSLLINKYSGNFIEVSMNFPDISSSRVRKAVKEGKITEIRDLVPPNVYDYLKK